MGIKIINYFRKRGNGMLKQFLMSLMFYYIYMYECIVVFSIEKYDKCSVNFIIGVYKFCFDIII